MLQFSSFVLFQCSIQLRIMLDNRPTLYCNCIYYNENKISTHQTTKNRESQSWTHYRIHSQSFSQKLEQNLSS